jgi:hypothetical protein
MKAVVVGPGEGRFIAVGSAGTGVTVKASGAETGDLCTVWEGRVPSGTVGAGPHYHRERDEFFYVLEGELVLRVDMREPDLNRDVARALLPAASAIVPTLGGTSTDLRAPRGLHQSVGAAIMSNRAASAARSSLPPFRATSSCISSRKRSKPAG